MIGIGLVCVTAATSVAAASDGWITTKTKITLLTTIGVDAVPVNVDTRDGEVTLHGIVGEPDTRRRSGEIARDIEGVAAVQNLIQVVSPARQERIAERDERIAERVTESLREHAGPGTDDVHVVSVNDGVVLLGGDAPSMSAHLDAIVTASRVPGVRRIETEVVAPGELRENEVYHLDRRLPAPAPQGDQS